MATINSTAQYHREGIMTLGWELTVCNALFPPESPCRKILKDKSSYGENLFAYLQGRMSLPTVSKVLEVGGGYGYLMRDLLARQPFPQVTMLDISPLLLQRQRETLSDYPVNYIETDFLEFDERRLSGFDWVILNENLGDFPTVVGLEESFRDDPAADCDPMLARVRRLYASYSLTTPDILPFNFNLGAVEALEKICRSGVPNVFLAEHSCEATVPEPYRRLIRVRADGNPERIALKGHDEYTIRFSDLVAVAVHHEYDTLRGPLADFLPIDFSEELRLIMRARSIDDDKREAVRQFVEDLFQYEYLLLRKRGIVHDNPPQQLKLPHQEGVNDEGKQEHCLPEVW